MCSAETDYRCSEGRAETWDTHHERGKIGSEAKNITRPRWTIQCPLSHNQYSITAYESSPLLDIHNVSIQNTLWLELLCVSWTPNKPPASGPSDALAVFQVIQSDTRFWLVQNQMWDFKNRVIKDGPIGKERRKQTRSCTVDKNTAFSFEVYCLF